MQQIRRKYLPEFIYGSIDGIITTFAVMSGALGAALNPAIILVLGLANLLADGFSMAVSNFLSTRSSRQVNGESAVNGKLPIKTALATLISFIVVGFIPLASFVFATFIPAIDAIKFELSIALTAFAFLFVGAAKTTVTEKNMFVGAIETLLIGGIAAVIAFSVGYFLKGLV